MSSIRADEGIAKGAGPPVPVASGARSPAVGPLARPLVEVLATLQGLVDAIDPAQVPARDAVDLVRTFDRISRVADAAKAQAARRVAESSLWSRGGHRSPAHWMAATTGVGVGEAVKLLDLAEVVADAPVVAEALAGGVVSPRQAAAAARAERAAPGAGRRLLDRVPSVSVVELEAEANRIVTAASTESEAERAARLRSRRVLRTGTDPDGMGYGHWLLEPAPHARLMALIEANKERIFHDARRAGGRESAEAYAADALAALADLPVRRRSGSRPTHGGAGAVDGAEVAGCEAEEGGGPDWSFAKVIVRVDLGALDRGEPAPGEVCEIAGSGPVPVADTWRMIDGGAFVAAVAAKGTDIEKVVHLGRRPTELQRTALEWYSAGECSIEGCSSPARIEVDHVAEWADTKVTALPELASPCGHHHDLKTHHGYRFGPRLPSGKRRLIPPPGERDGGEREPVVLPPDQAHGVGVVPLPLPRSAVAARPTPIGEAPSLVERTESLARSRAAHPSQRKLFDTG